MYSMPPPHAQDLTDGEVRLMEVLTESSTNQRTLARAAGLSLGMTNLLIKRLVKKGLIKVVTLNGRTLSYMLTPSGFAEKLRRSYEYLTTSIRYIDGIRTKIPELVAGHSGRLYVVGSGELAQLAQETLKQLNEPHTVIANLSEAPPGSCCLFCLSVLPDDLPPDLIIKVLF